MHSPQAISRAMELYNCHPDMLAPKGKKGATPVMARSLHPNHVWQLDASICVIFYLGNGNMGVMDEKLYNKNKPHNVDRVAENRVWRYIVVDHCSGAFYVHYVMHAESQTNALESLMHAMMQRGHSDVMYGVPKVLYTDGGPGHRGSMMKEFCQRLGIEHIIHETGNARATGSVESCQNIVERGFESRMAFASFTSLEEIQAASDNWRCHFCASVKHTRTRATRAQTWLTIKPEDLRIPVSMEALRELAMGQSQSRKVSEHLTISFASKATGKQEYDVSRIPNVYAGMSVAVRVNAFRAPSVDVTLERDGFETVTMTIEPTKKDQYGFNLDAPVLGQSFKAKGKTAAEKKREAILKDAFAVSTVEEAKKAERKGVKPYQNLDHFADVKGPLPTFMPRAGTTVGQEFTAPEVLPLMHIKAAQILQKRCGLYWDEDPRARMAYLRQRYPDGVPYDALDGIEMVVKQGKAHILESVTIAQKAVHDDN